MNKIVVNRLIYYMEEGKLSNENQVVFRQGRSTGDQVLKLSQEASDKIHRTGSSLSTADFFVYLKA